MVKDLVVETCAAGLKMEQTPEDYRIPFLDFTIFVCDYCRLKATCDKYKQEMERRKKETENLKGDRKP